MNLDRLRHARLALAAALAAALPLACGGAEPPPAALPPAARAPAPSAAVAPGASPAASAGPAAPPEPPSPFFPAVVNAQELLRVFRMGSVAVAVAGMYFSTPIRLEPKGARVDRSLFKGLKGSPGDERVFFIIHMSGDWPKSGALSLNLPGERGGTDVDYGWNGSSWRERPRKGMPDEVSRAYYSGTLYAELPWGDRTLYEIMGFIGDQPHPKLVLGPGGKSPPLPELTKGKGGACPTKLDAHLDLQVAAHGELIGLATVCSSDLRALVVERWPKGSRKASIEELPGGDKLGVILPGAAHLHIRSATDIDVIASFSDGDAHRPYVAHHDGRAWTDISPEGKEPVEGLWRTPDGATWIQRRTLFQRRRGGAWETLKPAGDAGEIAWSSLAPDGTLWARFGKSLQRFAGQGPWERVPLPRTAGGEDQEPEGVTWFGSETFVIAKASGGMSLLRSAKPDAVLDLDKPEPGDTGAAPPEEKQSGFGRVTAATPACEEPFVVLYKLSKVAPPDFDFPLTRAALKGHTEFNDVRFAETEDGGKRYLVAFVPGFAMGQKLVKLIQDKVQSSTPQLLCGKPPKVNREIAIDLRTGEIKK